MQDNPQDVPPGMYLIGLAPFVLLVLVSRRKKKGGGSSPAGHWVFVPGPGAVNTGKKPSTFLQNLLVAVVAIIAVALMAHWLDKLVK